MSELASLYFVGAGPNRGAVIRKVGRFFGISLGEAKRKVDSPGWAIIDGDLLSVVIGVQREFEKLGAEVRLTACSATPSPPA